VRGEQETEFIASLVAQIEAQDDVVLSDPTKQAPWHVAYSEGLRWVLRLLEKPVSAPVRAEAAKQFTVPTVLKMFQNLGHDTDCGACMGIAFTGAAFESHTCRPQPASASPVREAEPLKALESAARRVIGLAGVIRVYGPADRFREAVDALSAALEGAATKGQGND
jgi:hypothetical protein